MEPGAGAVFDQRRDVDSDPPGFQSVVFLRDDSFNAVPWRRGEAGGEAVRNLADGRFPLGVAHFFIVIQCRFRRQATFAGRWAVAGVAPGLISRAGQTFPVQAR